jgi:two-component system nitrate/nitrite response regulator NarL
MNKGRLIISGEGRLFREGLKQILQGSEMAVIGEAKSLVETCRLLSSLDLRPNLIVCDPSHNPEIEYDAMRQLLSEIPGLGIIVLGRVITWEWLNLARAVGARGFIPNDISSTALQALLQLALLGENIFASPSKMKEETRLEAKSGGQIADDLKVPLSPKEVEILQCLEGGMPNKVIARNLNIAEATVKVHLKSLLRKINVENRTQAAIWALNRRPEPDRQRA